MATSPATLDAISCDLTRVWARLQHLALPVWLELDVSMAQYKALAVVERADGISVGGVGQRLGIGEPSASLLVEQLVRRGYAERTPDPADRRRVLVRVTEAGRDLIDELRLGRRQQLAGWIEQLDPDDARALARGLRALAELIREVKE